MTKPIATRPLTEHAAKALLYVQANPGKTAPEIARAIGFPPKLVGEALRHAAKRGELVVHKGESRLDTTYTLGVLRERIPPKPKQPLVKKEPKRAEPATQPKTTKLPHRKDAEIIYPPGYKHTYHPCVPYEKL